MIAGLHRSTRPHKVLNDILANLLGKGWVALVSVLFVPFFIRYLGVEAYGLVGFFITLQTVLLLLDFGFSTTLNRAISATRGTPIPPEVTSLARKLEHVFIVFAVVILIAVLLFSPWFVAHWVVLDYLESSSVSFALRLMGFAIALQLPFMLYSGGLIGLGKQVGINIILAACATLRFGGALVVLMVQPTIEAFFIWQVIATATQTLWARHVFFRGLRDRSAQHQLVVGVFHRHIGFAAGVGLTAALGVILTQLDKLLLSKLLSMEDYGYYMLAWTLSSMLFMLAGPIVTAYFPRLTAEVSAAGDGVASAYHTGCQMLSVAVMPAGALLMIFPKEVLTLWLGNPVVVQQVEGVVVLLALGTLFNTLAQLPHALQLAFGRPLFGLYANALLVILVVPAIYFGVRHAGTMGAAWVWVALNAMYVVIGVPLMHMWLLRGHLLRWVGFDVLLPMAAAFSAALLIRQLLPLQPERSLYGLMILMVCYTASAISCVIVLPRVRKLVFTKVQR